MMDKKSFKKLEAEWRLKLSAAGFEDIEDHRQNLKAPDLRTNAFEQREIIRDFFLMIDHLLVHYPDMPKDERQIIELWSEGTYAVVIAEKTQFSYRKVKSVIQRYKGLIKAINKLFLNAHGDGL
jgi:hypothetical protein